jgi:hypothetical protein
MSNLEAKENALDPCQFSLIYPELKPCISNLPILPPQWECTALLHPFSPPPESDPQPNTPFFQLCTAYIQYSEGEYLSAQITGCSYGSWWYMISPTGTSLSTDQGHTWTSVNIGWSLPTTNWFCEAAEKAICAGTSPLNWMSAQKVNWWKIPVPDSNAATWYWFNTDGDSANLPFRLMFGQPPQNQPQPIMGDPAQLALFQMYSFTYFPSFQSINLPQRARNWINLVIRGFEPGNPKGYQMPIWNNNFGMTTLMTPVDAASNPLPTRVLYKWALDSEYNVLTDRAQNTLMWYKYNPNSKLFWEEALMFGIAPSSVAPPPYSGSSFLIDLLTDGSSSCKTMPLGQEAPDWAYSPGVNGEIQACITDNPSLCPNNVVMVISVLFPSSDEYPQGRYLWTWYSPLPDSNGTHSRPITFMESASTIEEGGTSLALADYFDYQEFEDEIGSNCFQVPISCLQESDEKTILQKQPVQESLMLFLRGSSGKA